MQSRLQPIGLTNEWQCWNENDFFNLVVHVDDGAEDCLQRIVIDLMLANFGNTIPVNNASLPQDKRNLPCSLSKGRQDHRRVPTKASGNPMRR